jgi:hypothetical protein
MVQELLPGKKIDHLDHRSLDQVLQLNQLQADRLADRPDIPAVELHLREDGAGYCLHGPLRRHNGRSAALERWIASVGADSPPRSTGADAVVTLRFGIHRPNADSASRRRPRFAP